LIEARTGYDAKQNTFRRLADQFRTIALQLNAEMNGRSILSQFPA
jgi:hypothetical protein